VFLARSLPSCAALSNARRSCANASPKQNAGPRTRLLDEATLTRAIGVETAKILWTAHGRGRQGGREGRGASGRADGRGRGGSRGEDHSCRSRIARLRTAAEEEAPTT